MTDPLIAAIADPGARDLVERAQRASKKAYAKHSEFFVGAAIRTASDKIHVGCNVENDSYGLTICAERNAVFAAVTREGRGVQVEAVGLYARTDRPGTLNTVSPCGACRQVLWQFCTPTTSVTFLENRAYTTRLLSDLLPSPFDFT